MKKLGSASVKMHQEPKLKDVSDMTVYSVQKIEENFKEPKETLKLCHTK